MKGDNARSQHQGWIGRDKIKMDLNSHPVNWFEAMMSMKNGVLKLFLNGNIT